MSYITDALKRAQKARDERYLPYRDIISTRPRRRVRGRKRLILGVSLASLVLLASTAFSLIAYFGQEGGLEPRRPVSSGPAVLQAKLSAAASQPARLAPEDPARDAEILFQAGLRRQQAGDLADAEALYRKAVESDPGNLHALNNLGVLCMLQRRDSEAIELFNMLIDTRGDWSDPYYNLACLFSRQGESAKAMKYLRVALRLNRDLKAWARDDSDLEPLHAISEYHRIVR